MKPTTELRRLQGEQERAWQGYVDTKLECRRLVAVSARAFYKAKKRYKEAAARDEVLEAENE